MSNVKRYYFLSRIGPKLCNTPNMHNPHTRKTKIKKPPRSVAWKIEAKIPLACKYVRGERSATANRRIDQQRNPCNWHTILFLEYVHTVPPILATLDGVQSTHEWIATGLQLFLYICTTTVVQHQNNSTFEKPPFASSMFGDSISRVPAADAHWIMPISHPL
jgi:hypothetical protein